MSRAYKAKLADTAEDLGATGVKTNLEKLSGADLAQVIAAAANGDSAAVDTAGTKTLGNNAAFGGSPNSAALSGADQERFQGDQ